MNTTRTLAQRIGTKMAHNLLAVLVIGGVGVASNATESYEYDPSQDRPDVAGSPSIVLADCLPVLEGTFPTSAVIQKDGAAIKVTKPAQVSKAFDTALGERTWPGVSAITLCR